MTNGITLGLLMGFILLCAAFAQGEEEPEGRHERFLQFLKKTAADISARSLSHVRSLEDWERQRPAARRQLLYMLGLEPLPERTPMQAQITGTLPRPDYRIEKIVFQSLPGLYVTGNLYLPEGESVRKKEENGKPSSLPTVLYVCGHSPHPLGAKWDYQDRAAWFVRHGYVCFVLDTLEFGEVPGLHHGIHDLNMWNWLSLGYTPVGVEVWNALRALDYLESRPEVDRHRVGMTGISGGGVVTWFTAAVDERIAAAVPVCSTYTFGSQAAHWVAAGQCDCIYFHNTFLTDSPLVGALIAPRPLLLCSGRRDGCFPPDGYHDVYRRVRRIYDLYAPPGGASDRIKEVDDDVGHSDAPLFLKEARQWMDRWLKSDAAPVENQPAPEAPREKAEDLACLSRLPADAVNYKIHDLFIPTAACVQETSLERWEERRRRLMQELQEKVFRWFPQERIPFAAKAGGWDGGWAARYADYQEFLLDSEPGVPIRAQLLQPKDRSTRTPLLLYAKRPGDSIYFLDLDELLPLLGRCAVLILNPRQTEHPVSAFAYAEIARTASWIGRTVAAMQVWDILRAAEWVTGEQGLTPDSIRLYGKGEMGIVALYAGLFDARVQQVILKDPPASHWQGPALLNVLRITDLPEVAGAFAPRRLTFLREVPSAFDSAQSLYQLYGCPDHLTCAGSLPEALEIWKHERSP
jgi:hypothetical protein